MYHIVTIFTIGQAQAQASPGQARTRPHLMSAGGISYFFTFAYFFYFSALSTGIPVPCRPARARARPRPMSAEGNSYFFSFAFFYFWPGS